MRLSEKGHTYALFAIVVITCALGSLSQTATNSMLTGICAEFFIDAGEGQWLTTVYMRKQFRAPEGTPAETLPFTEALRSYPR